MARIAFAGLGAMGRPMAANLAKAGHEVRGADLNPAALDWLTAHGGVACASAKEAAAGAEALVLMVVNADQAEAVLFEAGALEALAPNALVILCATCAPARAKAIGWWRTRSRCHARASSQCTASKSAGWKAASTWPAFPALST